MALEAAVLRANPVLDWEQFSFTFDRMNMLSPQLSHREVGGFWSAEFTVNPDLVTRSFASDLLTNGVMRQVEFYNHKGELAWEGFLATIRLDTGFVSVQTRWENMINKAWARFESAGSVQRSTTKTYDPSINRFGIKETVKTLGQVGLQEADQAIETFLRRSRWPSPQATEINVGGSSGTRKNLTLRFLGYWHSLKGRVYNQTSLTGDADASVIVEAIIDDVGQFVASKDIDTNVTQLQQNTDADRTADNMVEAIASFGDPANRRWVAGFRGGREFYFNQAAREN